MSPKYHFWIINNYQNFVAGIWGHLQCASRRCHEAVEGRQGYRVNRPIVNIQNNLWLQNMINKRRLAPSFIYLFFFLPGFEVFFAAVFFADFDFFTGFAFFASLAFLLVAFFAGAVFFAGLAGSSF